MAIELGITFPSEADALRQHVQFEARASCDERFCAVLDLLSVAETLSRAGKVRPQQLKYQELLEDEWQRRMKEFIKQHVAE